MDLPEPVRPAISACCAVPTPRVRFCRRVAPARPSGIDTDSADDSDHSSPGAGATAANGTSTRLASRPASPTRCSSDVSADSGGGASGSNPMPSSSPAPNRNPPVSSRSTTSDDRARSSSDRPLGGASPERAHTMVCTPQRAPLAQMLARRLAAGSLMFVGKSARTRNR